MITALKITLGILMAFTAIGLLCAVRIGRRRPPPADPFFYPLGDTHGFTKEQPARFAPSAPEQAVRPLANGANHNHPGATATPPVAGSGASSIPSGAAARASLSGRRRRAF